MLPIVGWQKTSLIDYPDRLSTILFTSGCNFRCPYCHNVQLVKENFFQTDPHQNLILESVIMEHLIKRKNLIDGVVITGGEPTLHEVKLVNFIRKVKEMGFLVKLDTNGTNPDLLKKLIADDLLDYVAMDLKTSLEEYSKIARQPVNLQKISESIDLLKSSVNLKLIELEFRSTLHPSLHTEDIFQEMVKLVAGSPLYVLQTFKNTTTLDPGFSQTYSFTDQQMKDFLKMAGPYIQDSFIRE